MGPRASNGANGNEVHYHISMWAKVTQVSDVAHGPLVLFMLSDIDLIFGTLLCHTKIQIKFEFGLDPSIFQYTYTLIRFVLPPYVKI